MGVVVRTGAAGGRSRTPFAESTGSPSVDPSAAGFAGGGATEADSFPEIDCVRALLSASVIDDAERRAAAVGVGADRVLIAAGKLSEEAYLRAFAAALGVAFESLDDTPRACCPLNDDRLIESAAAGMLPLAIEGELSLAVAPRGAAARRILRLIEENPARARYFRFTSAERLNRFVLRYGSAAIAARAATSLKRTWPMLSAAPPRWRANIASVGIVMLLALAAAIAAPAGTMLVFEMTLAVIFLAWLGLRLLGAFVEHLICDSSLGLPDDALPVYTVIAALYREAASVDGLLNAIERLNYPREKLDVLIAVEADDRETRAAIAARTNRLPVTVIPVPALGPRTKPKALNVVLPFARGTFTVIYDAEDRPEPDQLRSALQAFRTSGDDLACVQARLCIDNNADSWLAQLFTAEYAGQFDVFLPGLAALHMPFPLGGSSNHFYTAVLREAGGWDPYNVTEDADLGMRLARFGYRASMIDSTTYEEAPARFGPWLRQRTRWFKGWMQTWLVHMRQPARLLRDLGLPGFLTFQLIVGGNALAALVHPLFMAALIYSVASGTPIWRSDSATIVVLAAIYGTTAVIGYLTSAFLGWLGLLRRGLLSSAWILLLTPLHWLLLSLAAWRALYQLVFAPYAWEKTEHGLAKNSRRAANITRSLLELERYLSALKDAGDLPTLVPNASATVADQHSHPHSTVTAA
ncbi:MAG TPA: glycosyltransferase family 2 protein [Pseudolabrys sp.]|jgi:cellulose synthase/poly-beta-1,6-N-acetylglucosamine synthase-like glycosyltransferase